MRCLICEEPLPATGERPHGPYCSARCRWVDLGKWLGEEYRVPGRPVGDEADADPFGELLDEESLP